MNKAPFNFSKWNTIIGWFTFVILITYMPAYLDPTMSFGIVENISATATKAPGYLQNTIVSQIVSAFFLQCLAERQAIRRDPLLIATSETLV
jgi:hypothetical protein